MEETKEGLFGHSVFIDMTPSEIKTLVEKLKLRFQDMSLQEIDTIVRKFQSDLKKLTPELMDTFFQKLESMIDDGTRPIDF